jgi:vitamin B12 transporter
MRDEVMTRSILLTSAAAIAVLSTPATAQQAFELKEITVSSSLTPLATARSGASVDILDATALSEGDGTLTGTLAQLPAVSFSSNGGGGQAANLRVRGLDNRYIGVRFNGIDITDPSGPQTSFNFGGFSTAGLGRVEVLKGSQSAIYGSEAVGGVIDIETMRPTQLGFSGHGGLEAGSFGTVSGNVTLAQKSERGEVVLSYSQTHSDGISARAGDTERDGYTQKMASLTSRYLVTDDVTVGTALLWRDSTIAFDRSAGDNSGMNYVTQRGGRVFAEFDTGAISHELSLSAFESETRDPGGFTSYFFGKRQEFRYLGSADLGGRNKLNFGLEHSRESIRTSATTGAYENNALFAELQTSPGADVDLSLAARFDDHSQFGGHWSGRLAGVWQLNSATAVRAVLSTGFRAPSLYELFSSVGSPTLTPEQSRSAELGIEHRFGEAGMIKATVFYTEIDNLIDFDRAATACGSGFGCYNQVPGTTVSKGVEFAGRYALDARYTLFGNYTLTDARNAGARLPRVPMHDLVLGVEATFNDRLTGRIAVQHVADIVPSIFAPANNKVGDHTLVNLGLDYAVTKNATAYLRVDNLLDEDYETAGGYNMPGRAFAFGVRASF